MPVLSPKVLIEERVAAINSFHEAVGQGRLRLHFLRYHEGCGSTRSRGHYTAPGTADRAQRRRALGVIKGGRR